jgi:hypothetical protein
MASVLFRLLVAATAAVLLVGEVHAQDQDNDARMAATIARVCVAGMRSGEPLTVEQFGDQFVLDRVADDVTWLKHAPGQPWVHRAINGSRPGSCGANFSSSATHSMRTARSLAGEIARLEGMRRVSVTPMREAFTFQETPEPFDHERHPYIAYLPAAGFQSFFFEAAAPVGEAPQ